MVAALNKASKDYLHYSLISESLCIANGGLRQGGHPYDRVFLLAACCNNGMHKYTDQYS
jgi:hypothetical protein